MFFKLQMNKQNYLIKIDYNLIINYNIYMKSFKTLSNLTKEELMSHQDEVIKEYNEITLPYRTHLANIDNEIKKRKEEQIKNCNHSWIRECEYHNERFYTCAKCGLEK